MSFISRLFGKKEEEQKVGGMEDFMTLIRVYFQAVMDVQGYAEGSYTEQQTGTG